MHSDFRQAARALLRQRGFTCLVVLTLAVGIGASAAIFSVVGHVVLRPMPYPNGDRMAYISMESPAEVGQFIMVPSLALARDLTPASRSFEAVELYQAESRVTSRPDGAESILVLHVQPTLFGLLGARPRIGRTFGDPDMLSDVPNVALISHGLWKTRYGGDASLLEQDIRLDEQLCRIVGVTRPGFRVPRAS
jgi:putative ABC transport system permease protein